MKETLKNAFSQLNGNKLRTFLTMLGMLIGIGAVIIILSLGEGVKGFVNSQFSGVGRGTLQINAMPPKEEYILTQEDFQMLREIPQVEDIFPVIDGSMGYSNDYYNRERMTLIFGVPYNYEKVQSLSLKYGRMFIEQEEILKSNVIIVEDNFSKIMFNVDKPDYAIGKSVDIKVGGELQSFEIVGVTKSYYPSAAPIDEISPIIYMPFSTANQYLMDGSGKTYSAMVLISDEYDASDFSEPIRKLLEKKHGVEDVFYVVSVMEATDTYNDILDKLSLFTSVVAAVSLLVGGIGIMNIMLVTVRERTREIGIRKALGATDRQILTQFLIEALILTLLGGISGLLVGYVGGLIIASAINITASITAGMVIFSVGTSSFIGIVFGVYPAYKAAKLDPVEALRVE